MNLKVSQVAKRRNEFYKMAVKICKSTFVADDLVQSLFIKLIEIERNEGSLDRLAYGAKEINTYFCYRIMQNVFLDAKKRKLNETVLFYDPLDIEDVKQEVEAIEEELHYLEKQDELLKEVEAILNTLHWYDARLFTAYHKEVSSVRELAEETGISDYSIYNTLKNVKARIQKEVENEKVRAYNRAKDSLQ